MTEKWARNVFILLRCAVQNHLVFEAQRWIKDYIEKNQASLEYANVNSSYLDVDIEQGQDEKENFDWAAFSSSTLITLIRKLS